MSLPGEQKKLGKVWTGKRIAHVRPGNIPGAGKVNEVIDAANSLLNAMVRMVDGQQGKVVISDGNAVYEIPRGGGATKSTTDPQWAGEYSASIDYVVDDAVYTAPDSSTRILWVCETLNGPSSAVHAPTWPEPSPLYWRCYAIFQSSGSARFRVKSVQGDYVTCRTWNGTTEGDSDVLVAKPPHLRHSITAQTINSVGVRYSDHAISGGKCSRTVSASGYPTQHEMVIPFYFLSTGQDSEIWAHQPTGGTGVSVTGTELTWLDINEDARAWMQTS